MCEGVLGFSNLSAEQNDEKALTLIELSRYSTEVRVDRKKSRSSQNSSASSVLNRSWHATAADA
jgi:uncharacterized protein YqiB (DUF1249 family)